MKKLFTLTLVFLLSIGYASAEKTEDDRRYRNYTKNFIFTMDGIEFAVFPDGQFDFNYLNDRSGTNIYVDTGNVEVSFNSGYDYNRYVQYDTYGAVIQIEEIPIFYDSYGRVNQIGQIDINYRNGYVNRLGNLRVYYSRPGIINYCNGYINDFNRFYVYRPWHTYYRTPFVNRCVVYNNPYRANYFPIRYSWSYHVNYWNSPSYYNGCYVGINTRRNFYRPADRVNYRSFERGRRNSRGRAVAVNNRVNRNRQAISTGRSQVTRNNSRGRSIATNERATGRSTNNRATTRANRTDRNSRSTAGVSSRNLDTRNSTARSNRSTSRSTNRATTNTRSNRNADARINRSSDTRRTASTRISRNENRVSTSRGNRSNRTAVSNRSNRSTKATPRSSRSTNRTIARSNRSSAPKRAATSSRSSRSSKASTSRGRTSSKAGRSSSTRKNSRSVNKKRRG